MEPVDGPGSQGDQEGNPPGRVLELAGQDAPVGVGRVLVAGDSSMLNLPLGLALLRGQFDGTPVWTVFLAGSVLTTLPTGILFFIVQRHFVSSDLQTGLKG